MNHPSWMTFKPPSVSFSPSPPYSKPNYQRVHRQPAIPRASKNSPLLLMFTFQTQRVHHSSGLGHPCLLNTPPTTAANHLQTMPIDSTQSAAMSSHCLSQTIPVAFPPSTSPSCHSECLTNPPISNINDAAIDKHEPPLVNYPRCCQISSSRMQHCVLCQMIDPRPPISNATRSSTKQLTLTRYVTRRSNRKSVLNLPDHIRTTEATATSTEITSQRQQLPSHSQPRSNLHSSRRAPTRAMQTSTEHITNDDSNNTSKLQLRPHDSYTQCIQITLPPQVHLYIAVYHI